ncbi:MAG: XdhC family protein [Elusimicrobia bacterium]|nr:XdhC family protein [Elusimicrobiota bacterium]
MDSLPASVEFHPDLPRPAVLCTLVRILGSAPQQAWVKMWDSKMHCPIGIPLSSKNPKVIAVSVAAQVLREWGLKKG